MVTCITFSEYYEKLKSREKLPEAALLYVLSLHMNKSIGMLLKNGTWSTTNTAHIQDNNVNFVYLGDGVFLPIEHKHKIMKVNPCFKWKTHDKKLDAMGKVNLHKHTPIKTRQHTLQSCCGLDPGVKMLGINGSTKTYQWIKYEKKKTVQNLRGIPCTFQTIWIILNWIQMI